MHRANMKIDGNTVKFKFLTGLVDIYGHFGGPCCLLLQGKNNMNAMPTSVNLYTQQ